MKKRVLRERRHNATDTNVATMPEEVEVKKTKKKASKKKEAE